MSFKMEINYLNIDNYPSVESHLEDMASKDWLLYKIFFGTVFMYKKIEPTAVDFSISPYEVETFFAKKSKSDLKEFQAVSESVGWYYATKSYDLHIYFKSKNAEAVPMYTDEVEEFRAVESIAEKYLRSQYVLFPLLLFFSWFVFGSVFTSVHSMQSGLTQIIALLLPIGIIMSILHIFELRKFIKTNRKNVKLGKPLEFNTRNQWIYKILYSLVSLVILILLFYLAYSALVLRSNYALIAFLPIFIGAVIGTVFRIFIKPVRKGLGFKLTSFIIMIIIAGVVGALLGPLNLNLLLENQNASDPNVDKVLTFDHFFEEGTEDNAHLLKNASLLVPASHEYTATLEEGKRLRTEYSKTLSNSLAKNLINIYIQNTKNALVPRNDSEIEESIVEGNQLWKVDEAYFLSEEKDEVVLRNGKEVFYLAGMDFSDPTIIANAKHQIQLN